MCAGNETTSPLPVTFCALYSLQGVCGVSTASRRYSPCPVPCRGTTRIDDRFSTAVTSKRDWPVSPLPLLARERHSGLAGSNVALIRRATSGIRTLSRCRREEAFACVVVATLDLNQQPAILQMTALPIELVSRRLRMCSSARFRAF